MLRSILASIASASPPRRWPVSAAIRFCMRSTVRRRSMPALFLLLILLCLRRADSGTFRRASLLACAGLERERRLPGLELGHLRYVAAKRPQRLGRLAGDESAAAALGGEP